MLQHWGFHSDFPINCTWSTESRQPKAVCAAPHCHSLCFHGPARAQPKQTLLTHTSHSLLQHDKAHNRSSSMKSFLKKKKQWYCLLSKLLPSRTQHGGERNFILSCTQDSFHYRALPAYRNALVPGAMNPEPLEASGYTSDCPWILSNYTKLTHLDSRTYSTVERENTPKGSITPERLRTTFHRTHTALWQVSWADLFSYCSCLFNTNTGPHATYCPQSLVNSNNLEKLVLLLFYLADEIIEALRNQVIYPISHSCLKTIKLLQMKCDYSLVHRFFTSISWHVFLFNTWFREKIKWFLSSKTHLC